MLAYGLKKRMKVNLTEEEYAALMALKYKEVNILDAALLARTALTENGGRLKRAQQCFLLGKEQLANRTRTVAFRKAVEEAVAAHRAKRKRTLTDFRYLSNRLLRCNTGLVKKSIRSMTTEDCRHILGQTFTTPQQYRKGRAVLSNIFSIALRRGWCTENPVRSVETIPIREHTIPILSVAEIAELLQSATRYRNGCCLAAIGMMLYGGIRPHEVARLTWRQVDFQNLYIYILPKHSKTGGARRISIRPPLMHLLKRVKEDNEATPICPKRWLYHWKQVRRLAGWNSDAKVWHQDALRHTFASYHLAYFHDYSELQWETGHRDSSLLRTRYINMKGITDPAQFWQTLPCNINFPKQQGHG